MAKQSTDPRDDPQQMGLDAAKRNVTEALEILTDRPNHSNAAVWRLVDAAGILLRNLRPDTYGACAESATDRGFYVGSTR